jgi:peptidoglycan/xylan/chitin deacetylase (PgdA/CDA1 family)
MKNLLVNLLYDLGIASVLRRAMIRGREVSILTFHRVNDEDGYLWRPMPVATFRSLMEELAVNAHVVPLQDVGEVDRYPDRPLVVLSFDDGYMDFWLNALPILVELGLPAHHNICPNLIETGIPPWTQVLESYLCTNPANVELPGGGVYRIEGEVGEPDLIAIAEELACGDDEVREKWIEQLVETGMQLGKMQLMGWEEVAKCVDLGVSIGSHGSDHRNLAKIGDLRVLRREIMDSKKKIEEVLGVSPEIFSFPNGLYDATCVEMVKECGYRFALLCEDRPAPYGNFSGKDFQVATRIAMRSGSWQEENLRYLGLHRKIGGMIARRSASGSGTPLVRD